MQLIDVTASTAVLALMGPKSRDVLAPIVEGGRDAIDTVALPFMRWRNATIAGAPVRMQRVTYVGELGWELHIPVDFAVRVFEAIVEAGAPHGLRLAGYRAIESLRLEKGYRAWSSDIGPDHTPLEAGLGWAVKLKTSIDFIGRAALEVQRAQPLKKRLVGFIVDGIGRDDVILLGRETVFRDGKAVGWLTSAGWGYTIGANVGYGYVRDAAGVSDAMLESGRYELEVAGERVPARLVRRPLVDPVNARIRL